MRKFCNIFIQRNIYTLFLIFSEKNLKKSDNIILLNKNFQNISEELIFFLKKNKFRVIYDLNFDIFISDKKKQNNILSKFHKLNFFSNLINRSNDILNINYNVLDELDLNKYHKINLYQTSDRLYYGKLFKKYKNINIIFLEHGLGNFLSLVKKKKKIDSLKFKIIELIKYFFLKFRKINQISLSYYYGIYGKEFNLKEIEYVKHKIVFLNDDPTKGFNKIYKFYFRKLKKIKLKKKKYIYIDIPMHLSFQIYKKFIYQVFEKLKLKKNHILLVKTHPSVASNKELIFFKNFFSNAKINFFIFNERSIPLEFVIKYFNVTEIYTAYSNIIYTSHYFCNKKIKIDAYLSSLVKKKYTNFAEFSDFSNNFLKKNNKNKYLNFYEIN